MTRRLRIDCSLTDADHGGEVSPCDYSIRTFDRRVGRFCSQSFTDSVKDRLAAFYHWKDLQSLEQAVLVARQHTIDLNEVRRWSQAEGFGEEFALIRKRLEHAPPPE
jgi:hypothetical protein